MLPQIGRAALAPLWMAQLATGTKSFERNGLIGSRRLNEWGLHAARVALAHRIAASRRRRLEHLISPAEREAYDRDGFVMRHDFLPRDEFAALHGQLEAYRGVSRDLPEGDTIMRKVPLDRAARAAMPSLDAVLRSPDWHGLIRYIGSRDAEPVVWIQSLSAPCRRRPGGSADFSPRRHLSSDGQGLAVPDRCRRGCRPVHLCSRLAPADAGTARLGAADEPDGAAFGNRRGPAGLVPRRPRRAGGDGISRAARLRGAGQHAGRWPTRSASMRAGRAPPGRCGSRSSPMDGAARSCPGPGSIRGPGRPWRGAACSAGRSRTGSSAPE